MKDNTYWLHWKYEDGVYGLYDWENNALGESASKAYWPGLTEVEALGTVLAECHEKQERIERNIELQELPHLDTSKLPFRNIHIVATPMHDDFIGDFIECVYTVGE